MPSDPVGFLLTWSCYGSWLHGDERGSVDKTHNTYGTPFLPPNPLRERGEMAGLGSASTRLNRAALRVVRETIVEHWRIRGWTLHVENVRTRHVHVVVSCSIHPDIARDQFKAWCTRRLRESSLFAPGVEIWTEGGSDEWLWDEESLYRAIVYVRDLQGEELDPETDQAVE